MLGRQVTAALRRPLQARFRVTSTPQTPTTLCIRTFSHAPHFLNPAGRPKKAVGEPSRPVKRSVKKDSKSPADSDSDAAAKNVAAREKAAAKKKSAAKKAKPVRQLTPEQLEKKKLALQKAQISELKKVALQPPKLHTGNAYSHYIKDKSASFRDKMASSGTTGVERREASKELLTEHARNLAAEWKTIYPSELEHYNHLAHTAKEAAAANFKRWVESHSVEEIELANSARRKLRRRNDKKDARKWPAIEDERLAKKPMTAWVHFCINRHASGDFLNIPVTERSKLISQEWKALDAEEKQKYQNLATRDAERFAEEKKRIQQPHF